MIKKLLSFLKGRKRGSLILFVSFASLSILLFLGIPSIAVASAVSDALSQIYGALIMAVSNILRLTYYFAKLAYDLLVYTMKPENFLRDDSITGDKAYYAAWASVRDIANMAIVLGFVFIGVATTLRIQNYAAQKKLPILIIVAILINFTPLFCGLIIDSSNIIAKSIATDKEGDEKGGIVGILDNLNTSLTKRETAIRSITPYGSATGWESFWMPIYATFDDTVKQGVAAAAEMQEAKQNLQGRYLRESFINSIFFVFSGTIFLILAGILAARYAMLILLFIISPLAFFCIIFPFSKKWFDEWLGHFLKWSFVGVTTLFCIYLGGIVLDAAIKAKAPNPVGLMDLFIVCIFLYVGFKLAMKSSGAGAALMTGAMGAVGGFALGAVKTVGGKTLGAMGGVGGAMARKVPGVDSAISLASSVSQKGGMMLEGIGLRKVGVTASKRAAGVNKAKEAMKGMSDAEIKTAVERKGADHNVVAAGMEKLASKGNLGVIDSKKLPRLTKKATARGVDRDIFTKAAPQMATASKEDIKKETQAERGRLQSMGMSPQAAKKAAGTKAAKSTIKTAAQQRAVEAAVRSQSPENFGKNITKESMAMPIVYEVSSIKQTEALGKASPTIVQAAKVHVTPGTSENAIREARTTKLRTDMAAHRASGNIAELKKVEKQFKTELLKAKAIKDL